MSGAARRWAIWIGPLVLLALWQGASSFGAIPARILPAPIAVLQAGLRLTLSGSLPHDIAVSSARALVGLVIGGSVGFALGLLTGVSRLAQALLDPSLQMIRNIPHLALLPLVIIWFGVEESARIFLVALGVFFPIYLNTYHGIRTVEPQLIEMGRVYGMSRWDLFGKIFLPGALASIFVGLRFALGIMWLTLIVAETLAASSGIGHMAIQAREFVQTDVVMLSIVIYALLGKLADSATRLLEEHWLAWSPAYAKGG